jgi:hypothetical protein
MVALLRDHDKARIESTGALVGILALPLPPVEWIHVVGKLYVHLFVNIIVRSMFNRPFDSHMYLFHLQDLMELELTEMPICNLAETVHNKWL